MTEWKTTTTGTMRHVERRSASTTTGEFFVLFFGLLFQLMISLGFNEVALKRQHQNAVGTTRYVEGRHTPPPRQEVSFLIVI
jgi:hypothetical protein